LIYIEENSAIFTASTGVDTVFTPDITRDDQTFAATLLRDETIRKYQTNLYSCYAIDILLRFAVDSTGRYATAQGTDTSRFTPLLMKDDPIIRVGTTISDIGIVDSAHDFIEDSNGMEIVTSV